MEKIKRDESRVNISKLEQGDISGDELTGGYIVKIDKPTGSSCGSWMSSLGDVFLQIEYPKCEEISYEQKHYIKQYINDFEYALFSDLFADTANGYRDFIDENSFIDYLILNEISKNIDAYKLSTFMYKDRNSIDGKLKMGPIWDYNIAFGNVNFNSGNLTEELMADQHIWWSRLMQDTIFNNLLKSRWKTLRENQLSNEHLISVIDSLALFLDEAQKRNFEKWDILGQSIRPNYFVGETYQSEIAFLKGWLINRINWLDCNLPGNDDDYLPFWDYEAEVFPNPFLYFITYKFALKEPGCVSLIVYDIHGKLVKRIIDNQFYNPGKYKTVWNGYTRKQRFVADGIYILNLEIDNKIISSKKIIKRF